MIFNVDPMLGSLQYNHVGSMLAHFVLRTMGQNCLPMMSQRCYLLGQLWPHVWCLWYTAIRQQLYEKKSNQNVCINKAILRCFSFIYTFFPQMVLGFLKYFIKIPHYIMWLQYYNMLHIIVLNMIRYRF